MEMSVDQTTKWIEGRLAHLGLNQTEFAIKAGIEPADISRYKLHKAEARMDNVTAMAKAFEVDVLTMLIVLGLIDPDGSAVPRLVEGQKNSKVIWKI